MAAITYTAMDRGDLISGHSELTQYSFDIPLVQFTRKDARNQKTVKSLSGARFTTLHSIENIVSVATAPENDATVIANMREFLTSVAAGEEFSIDALGSVVSPNNVQAFKLEGNYSENLVDISGFYSFSFQVVRV